MSTTESNYQETDLGNVSLNPRGEYDPGASYEYLDTVSYQGGSYTCLAELGTTITGTAPDPGRNTDAWQMLTLPGGLTPEYIAMHDDTVNHARQAESSRLAAELAQQAAEDAQADVQQLHADTRQAATETGQSRDSAAGYAQSADASRRAAAESEQNINAQVTGFDAKVSESVTQAQEDIANARQQAIRAVASQQVTSTQAVKDQTADYISEKKAEALRTITSHTNQEIARANAEVADIKNALDRTVEQAQKVDSDITRALSEANAATASATRAAEKANAAGEATEKAEATRNKNEETRKKNEETRSAKETERVTAETSRQTAETKRAEESAKAIENANNVANALKEYTAGEADVAYKEKVAKATSKAQVDDLFAEWWKFQYKPEIYSKADMMERWFGNVLEDDRIHGEKQPLYSKSTSMIGELTDDSAGLVCTPSTETTAGSDPFAHLPQFWCIEVSAEKNADGSHEIFYVEHIDDTKDVRSGEHLCWVLQKNTWKREWKDGEYKYLKTRCHPASGYERWPEGTDRTGKVHEYMAHPKYYAGIGADGKITCGTGLKPLNRMPHQTAVAKWRARGAQYAGASGSLAKFLDAMVRLKYGRKGNSGKIEGCTNYNFQYTAAISETGVQRVILTTAQAANLFVGSAVMIGVKGDSTDRNQSYNYSVCDGVLITDIKTVQIDGTDYAAVYVDNGGKTFDTTANSTYFSTSPYYSGWNDNVLGRDGSRYNSTSGKEPAIIQGIEFMNGAYMIIADELCQWGKDEEGNYTFDLYKCYDQTKCGNAIDANYIKLDVPTIVLPPDTPNWSWKYIPDNAICKDALWPDGVDASGSGVGVGAGFYCYPAASGVRASWVFGYLSDGGVDGVACRRSSIWVSNGYWYGAPGAPGSEG